ncbi:MAG: hypothetical protein U9R08_04835 [Nanoarchaeota archaeon]|nr:hypothetical protein [Nanoarchaeota archaeon]
MSLEKKLAEMPIIVPESPFWSVFKRFGRDEVTSGVFNITGTAIASPFLKNGGLGSKLCLAAVGPIVEKVGLMYWHFKKGHDTWKTTPKESRDSWWHCIKNSFNDEAKATLIEDICIHDPIYGGLLVAGMYSVPEVPIVMLSGMSFAIAVVAAATLEVAYTEHKFRKKKKKLIDLGFESDEYLESRFYIARDVSPEKVIDRLSARFSLDDIQTWNYHDRYFSNHLKSYSGRTAKVRLRHRLNGLEELKSAQITFTRATQLQKEKSQHNFYPTEKEKYYFSLDKVATSIEGVEDENVKDFLNSHIKNFVSEIEFERTYARNEELLVSHDRIDTYRPFSVVELKTRNNVSLLKEAMRYLMIEFPVLATTHGKSDLVHMNGKL